ncbi:hypothetical protein J4234_06470 [Candidatus Woesearchaeota archaeon]|nr:hypothetical protein [Candidatus Woesearchaeota archaeon]
MIAKEVLKKLEFGITEFLVGALMVIGLVGYFASVPADLDWIDHTVSFVLFSYLFYKMDITSILFGKTSRFANSIIIVSYFSLFFKDMISYTSLNAFKFKIITFVNNFYVFFSDNLAAATIFSFYIGIIGILMVSLYLTKKIEISHPSFLYSFYQKNPKNNPIKFLLVFGLLLGFYYFVYNTILEWLEFTIDDPVIAIGIVFFVYKIAKHHQKFHPSNFIFKIGDFSSGWYRRFISLFHYKKTLPLAISGLLILHALSDLGVFGYSLIFLKENFYLEFLKSGHTPFLKLFLEDAKSMPSFAAIPLFIDYALNALSLIVFLLIPALVWMQMFSQKKLHFNGVFLFFVYSSAAAYMLLPGYAISPITELSTREGISLGGVDILSASLLESKSVLDKFFPNKTTVITAVSLISIIFGLAVYLLSSKPKVKRELYALSIIGGLVFYALYIFYFFSGLLDFYDEKLLEIFIPHFLIFIVLVFFLIMSILFYVGGYLMFLYEIVMEYHKRKWSEPIDNELVNAIRKIKKFEKRVMKPRKAQIIGEVFKYGMVGVFSVVILIAGYNLVNVVKERACKTEIAKFEIDLRNLDKSVRFGAKELQSYDVPCKADQIYFFDLNRNINSKDFKEIPIIKDSIESSGNNNVFIVKEGEVKRSFYAGNLEMLYPYHICFTPKFDRISFFIEGAGNSAKVASSCDQPECTFIPIEISEEDSKRIIREAVEFGCENCPTDFNQEVQKIRLTKQNVELFRKFTFCDGITNVEILIRPKKGQEIRDFSFVEFIPKTCIEDLNEYLAENVEGDVEIRSDPLIMWHFDGIGKEQKISYKLSINLDDECRDAIKGLGVAQFIEEQKEKDAEFNTAPAINGLNDITLSGIKLHRNVITNIWRFAQDKETEPKDLIYTIIDQTNSNLVDCVINEQKHMDCEVKQNIDGASKITIQVDDGEFRDAASFNVHVSQFCQSRARKTCVGNNAYWLDSCSNLEEIYETCESGEECKDGECQEQCTPNVERRCAERDKIYWFDSCGKKGSLYYDCRGENLAQNQCRGGQCCIGNVFCQNP